MISLYGLPLLAWSREKKILLEGGWTTGALASCSGMFSRVKEQCTTITLHAKADALFYCSFWIGTRGVTLVGSVHFSRRIVWLFLRNTSFR